MTEMKKGGLYDGAGEDDSEAEGTSYKQGGGNKPVLYSKANGRYVKSLSNVMQKLKTFEGKEEGTYNYHTGEKVDLSDGYMVTFHQNEPDENGHYKSHYGRYTPEEYDKIANQFANDNNSEVYVGVFDDEPEISFKVGSKEEAYNLMIKHNQDSIWDNFLGSIGEYDFALIKNIKRDKSKNPLRGE